MKLKHLMVAAVCAAMTATGAFAGGAPCQPVNYSNCGSSSHGDGDHDKDDHDKDHDKDHDGDHDKDDHHHEVSDCHGSGDHDHDGGHGGVTIVIKEIIKIVIIIACR